jgi:RNA polymerase sigma factor (sigma-70 family)
MSNHVSREMSRLFGVGAVSALTDLELLDRFVNGDVGVSEGAFEILVERHGAMVMNVCLDVLRDRQAAEDAFQATFVVLVRKARWLRGGGSPGSWLHGVALRTARKARVSAARRHTRELVLAQRAAVILDDTPECDDLEELLHEEIDRLPKAYRTAVVPCYLEGLSQEAAARQLLRAADAVRGRLARVRKMLRERMVRRDTALPLQSLALLVGPRPVPSAGAARSLARAVQAAGPLASRETAIEASFSVRALTIAKGALKSMFLHQLRTALFLTLGLAVLSVSLALFTSLAAKAGQERGKAPTAPGSVPSKALDAFAVQRRPEHQYDQVPKPSPRLDPELARLATGTVVATAPVTKDCMVLSYIPGWAHGEVDNIGIGNYDGGYRTLIEWQPIDPSLTKSEEHRFLLALYARKRVSAEPPGPILAFSILEDWPERTPWTNQPAIELEPAGSFKFADGEGWKVFDITPIVRAQTKPGAKNHGVMLRFLHEDRSSQGPKKSEYDFVSREGAGEFQKKRPVVLIVKPGKL